MSFAVPLHAIMREIPRSLEQPRRLKHLEGNDFSDKSHILMCGNGRALLELFLRSRIEPMCGWRIGWPYAVLLALRWTSTRRITRRFQARGGSILETPVRANHHITRAGDRRHEHIVMRQIPVELGEGARFSPNRRSSSSPSGLLTPATSAGYAP